MADAVRVNEKLTAVSTSPHGAYACSRIRIQVPDLESDGGDRDGLAAVAAGFAAVRDGGRPFSAARSGFDVAAAEAGATGLVALAAGGSVETAATASLMTRNPGAAGPRG
jgi:hypothetical protein